MFTGIVEELGKVRRMPPATRAGQIHIDARVVLESTRVGDSIAVNGICLTVVEVNDKGFVADVMPETLRSSNLGHLSVGDRVNLERAMPANGRFGGHIVTGHIDGTGRVQELRHEQNAHIFTIEAPQRILDLIVEKGSIAVDGISLTVASVTPTTFSISIIPHTAAETTLAEKRVGDSVNLENDIVGKYVRKLCERERECERERDIARDPSRKEADGLTLEYLRENGF